MAAGIRGVPDEAQAQVRTQPAGALEKEGGRFTNRPYEIEMGLTG